jgi:hypothetical protein
MKILKANKNQIESLIEKRGVGKHILKWSTGSEVVVHISKAVGQITVMENDDNRPDQSILKKLSSK